MVSHSLAAAKRLRKELQVLQKSPDDADILLEHNPDNLLQWKAWIRGPVETPYEGGDFELDIRCGTDYPLAPPSIKFVTKIFHPNVHFRTGDICLDILKKEWSPAWGLQAACRAVLALLSDPDPDRPLNCDAGNMLRGNADVMAYEDTAAFYTVENAQFLSWPVKAESKKKS
ncbi:peroxin-4 [Fistulifera solaris]|uniref:Peroxin-4 n=1 Tax=Fistulifera solaris TaxID=1519565 RepID=A0A1Z5JZI5_FISSO|nr:peroxin-4 [Fistulifera solaris]|eukprot:GAX19329.1 peroxin-4 [Fistulifera solaris]